MTDPGSSMANKNQDGLRSPDLETPEQQNTLPDHNVDFQAAFPGWPKGYFMGILPVVSLGAMYRPMGLPAYDYTRVEEAIGDIPAPNSVFRPTTPDPMYVACMPWCSYPYGVPAPVAAGASGLGVSHIIEDRTDPTGKVLEEASFLAVPTPRGKAKKRIANYWGAP